MALCLQIYNCPTSEIFGKMWSLFRRDEVHILIAIYETMTLNKETLRGNMKESHSENLLY